MSLSRLLFFAGIAFLSALFIAARTNTAQDASATGKELIVKMLSAIDHVATARYSLSKQERLHNGKYFATEIRVKMQTNPFNVYICSVVPNPGAEALLLKNKKKTEVLINPNRFPFINLTLNPYNPLLRDDQHHTILDVGFRYIASVVKSYMEKTGADFFNFVIYEGDVEWKGNRYYKLVIDNRNFGYEYYMVQKGENVTDIAKKLFINDYMIVDINHGLNGYNDVRTGQRIKIPNSYAKRIVFYLDKSSHLPMCQLIYDEKGLYEYYALSNFVLNPRIDPSEFTPQYKDYGF